METQKEMVKVETWTLVLIEAKSGPITPVFYYNPMDDIFERKFNSNCGYWSEKHALEMEKKLNIEGLEVVKGTMDVPRVQLIDSIMETFVEHGLVKGEWRWQKK